ncbi:hypothetical protein Sste5346_005424 [Sporothrix stenoceras]|uniref:Protamine P1 n=1 Tax=Sporothrix stenoceras TaxID=5173 RepID=A0ABR3Z4T7_9PEZI
MPYLPIFNDELQLCGEPAHDMDEVLLSGSDNEYYDSPGARSRRLEEQARLFLEGRRPRLLSASLKGPFGTETGWENPWRGRGSKIAKKGPIPHSTKVQRPSLIAASTSSDAGVGNRKQPATIATRLITRSVSNNDLGTTPSTSITEKDPELKKRAAGTDWLKRKNLKRLRPNYDHAPAASPSASRSTRAASFARAANANAPKTPLTRPVPEPTQEATVADDEVIEDSIVKDQGSVGAGLSVSHISDSQPPMSIPSDLLRSSHVEVESSIPEVVAPEVTAPPAEVETAEHIEEGVPATFGDDTTLLSEKQDESKEADESIPGEPQPNSDAEADVDTSKPTDDAENVEPANVEPVEPTEEAPDEPNVSNFADTTSTTCTTERVTDDAAVLPNETKDTEMPDARLATQDQSPWAKTQTNVLIDDMLTDSPAAAPITEDENSHEPASITAQSPWARETQNLIATTAPEPELPFADIETNKPEPAGRASLPLSQNPWAEVNTAAAASFSSSHSNLPTSPCSPEKDAPTLPHIEKQGLDHDAEPFLPSLPIPIVHSSGTAPSTPDTKQSSLPTPDMTVSIKSFRRFRSPTPTPPPRRRSAKGGPKSILSQPRRRSGVNTSATKSGNRVRFSLPEDEAAAPEGDADNITTTTDQTEDESRQPQRAASPPPQDKALMESLPTEVDRFKGHFATMAGRTRSQQKAIASVSPSNTTKPTAETDTPKVQPITISKRQDPALDLELYSSPSVDAMASRFQEADAETSKLQQISSGQSRQSSVVSHSGDKAPSTDGGHNKENATLNRAADEHNDKNHAGDDDDAASVVDDVQDVMDNLGDFLGLWDMDAELAEVRACRM